MKFQILILLLILLNCSSEKWSGKTEIKNGVTYVHNPEIGLWQDSKKLVLENDLLLESDENDENKIFFQITNLITDLQENIYLSEYNSGIIRKFDKNGGYILTIGKKGKGPGELIGPIRIWIDKNDTLFVFDWGTNRVSLFDLNGLFLGSLKISKFFNDRAAGFIIDNSNYIFLSCYDRETETVIHKFTSEGNYLKSFGDPVQFDEPIGAGDMNVKRNSSKGRLFLNNNFLFYTQRNPYEIRKYLLDGSLKMIINRENTFMPKNKAEVIDDNSVRISVPSMSTLISIWKNKLINCVYIPQTISEKIGFGTVIDLFDLEGRLLITATLKENISFHYISSTSSLLGVLIDENYDYKIVRYRLSLK